ncbi:MAG: phosphohydrolase [Desulfobacterales bacterium]
MKCPGQDMQFWKPGDIFEVQCPNCGRIVEFFKDDTARRCGGCGHRFANPKMDFGCAAYCPYAEQCLGDLPPELVAQQENLLKDRVAVEVKRFFGRDFRRIGRASRAARHAENLARAEGAKIALVLSAVYLNEVDAVPDDKGDKGVAGEKAAERILRKAGAGEAMIEGVLTVLEEKPAVDAKASLESRIVNDALILAEIEATVGRGPGKTHGMGEGDDGPVLLTRSGREEAERLLVSDETN